MSKSAIEQAGEWLALQSQVSTSKIIINHLKEALVEAESVIKAYNSAHKLLKEGYGIDPGSNSAAVWLEKYGSTK